MEIPFPRFRVDRLTNGPENAQAFPAGGLQRLRTFAHQRPQGSRRCIENVDVMLVDHLPEARSVRVIGHPFENQRGRAIGQRAIDDITMPSHPPDIGGAPVDFTVTVIEHVFVRQRGLQQIAARCVQHAFGFSSAA